MHRDSALHLFFASDSCIVAAHDICNLLIMNVLAKTVVLALIGGFAILSWSGLHQHAADAEVTSIHGGHIHSELHQNLQESDHGSSIGIDLSVLDLLFLSLQLLIVALSAGLIALLCLVKQLPLLTYLPCPLISARHRWRPPLRAPPTAIF